MRMTFNRRSWSGLLVAVAVALPFIVMRVEKPAADPVQSESAKAFEQMARVMLYPRCLNCHSTEEWPAQGDDHHRHANDVIRSATSEGHGANGFGAGAGAMPCFSCHGSRNMADGRQPGAPGWRMPPKSMGWDHLGGASELCHHVLDRNNNGDRSPQELEQHMTEDPLVNYAFDPGAHTKPPLTQAEFREAMHKWVEGGAACPEPGSAAAPSTPAPADKAAAPAEKKS